ncbi:hypothetical protein OF829_03620 [Sphingomonas sp. LB-2]|uniref:hypothetical protein n=1 Tax=Sphingomonas caeni TaxID=2984949 RepID=UPI00222ECA99|nr:hypothetical protein [Sphingomonas caeni]MCW3846315.1 hypothetical protein [Sphingomonas caeni]
MLRRILPVISLWLLSPLVAEYLLGSMPVSLIGALPVMAAMYGSAALLIREGARRSGGGWVTIALLGIAYGLIEEGFITQSLFNPNYLHLRLLDFGYVPALGTGLPWLVFVVTIHAVWSIAVPIGFAEALFPARREQSWLGPVGVGVFALIFLAGAAVVARFTYQSLPFMASPGQFAGAGLAVAALIAAAFAWPRFRTEAAERPAPPSPALFALAFGAGSALMLLEHFSHALLAWPWQLSVAAMIAIEAAFVGAMALWTRGRRWNDRQRFALMAGGLAVYGVFGFLTDRELHGAADLVPHSLVAILALALALLAGRNAARSDRMAG